jgi:cytochrome P450
MPGPDINLIDASVYERSGPPHEQFAWLREHAPVYWHADGGKPGWPGFWAVTRLEEVAHVSRHPEFFSSAARTALFREYPESDVQRLRQSLYPDQSANRDEEVFDLPQKFDIGRNPNPHVGFGGGGPHFCLGRHLAALELRILLQTVAKRMPGIALDGEVSRLRSTFVNGIKHLPVRFAPATHSTSLPSRAGGR